MPNTRDFCSQEGNEQSLVLQIVEVRDAIGYLAVKVLAAREDLSTLSYKEMLNKLYDIVDGLHYEFEQKCEH